MTRMPGVTSHSFANIPKAEIPRSSFDRSHAYKTTLNSGFLYPIFVDEVLPGDTFNLSMTGFARLSTPLKPIMDNAYFNTFFFFVPNRLLWTNWKKFNGEQTNPGDSTQFLVPQVTSSATGFGVGTIYDYMGLPVITTAAISASAFHLRAYNLIYNEWFRDENLQASVTVPTNDGPDLASTYTLLRRGKRHDYFTASLPWPQKSDAGAVTIPLGTQAIVRTQPAELVTGPGTGMLMRSAAGAQPPLGGNIAFGSLGGVYSGSGFTFAGANPIYPSNLYADLTTATAATINQLRQAFQIQRLYERDARGGTRYTEIVRAHFGVVSPDARLQRPEYLGGGQSPVLVSQVPQTGGTGSTGTTTPQGNLAAFGTSTLHGHGFSKAFTEHGVILGLISIRADLTYQRGLHRMWSRRSRFDFFWPALGHIGEQAVLSQEIYCDGSVNDQSVWGYQERYAEYRYFPSTITGLFRSNVPTPLDIWHLSQDFGATRPLLNSTFIQDTPPFARVVAVPSEPTFIFDSWFQLRCARPMPVYGVPGLIDHF